MTDDPFKPIAGAVEEALQLPERESLKGKSAADNVPRESSAREGGLKTHDFSVEALNLTYALVLQGSRVVIMAQRDDGPIEDRRRVLTVDAFKTLLRNHHTEVRGADGKLSLRTFANAWLDHPLRRQFHGIEFYPDPASAIGTPGYFNLWQGFAYAPSPKLNGWKILRDHLLNNVAAGDPHLFDWVFGFFAHMFQKPRERIGVALVLRGRMGSGKTIVGEAFGALLPAHYFLVDDPRYVVGNFNAHMASCLLLQADEAVWAGDKAAEGRLKGLITSSFQQIEAKGVDPIRLANFMRLVMTSNESWVVPAGADERRFAVLDVDPRCIGNHTYFVEMSEELNNGGYAALLHDLLTFDLSCVDLRTIPKTPALLDQKERSLSWVDSWWLGRLIEGHTRRGAENWERLVSTEALRDDYYRHAQLVGVHRRADETAFGKELLQLVPGIMRSKPTMNGERTPHYGMPSLPECRASWDDRMGQTRVWPEEPSIAANESD